MVALTARQKDMLSKYMPDYEKHNQAYDLLWELDEVMRDSLDENDEGTNETTIIAQLYDEIYLANS